MSRHFHPQPISGLKEWLDHGVRRLSRIAVGKDKSQETVWKDPPAWWSRESKHPWRNPTAPKQKDTLQTLKDKFICLEQHLRKENKIPDDMIEEITEWKENRLSNLFFMTFLSSLLGQCSAISRLLNELPEKKIKHSNYISSMLAELLSMMEENVQKTKNFVGKETISNTLEPTLTSPSRSTLQKRALEADSTANESLCYPVPKKRPRQPSSHSKSSPSSSHATSSPCTQLPSEILNTIRHNVLSSTSNSIEITPQQPTPTNLFVQPAAVDHNLVKSTMVNKPQHPPVNSAIYPLQSSTSDSQSFEANCFDISVEDNYSVMSSDEAYHSDTSSVENTGILPSQADHSKRHFSESECLDTLTTDTDVGNTSPHPNDTSILENISATSNMSPQMVFIKPAHSNMSSFNAVASFNDTSWEDHSMSSHHSINSSANSSTLAPSLQINSSQTSFSGMDCYDITVQGSTSDVPYQSAILSGNISPHPTHTSALENISATSEMSLTDENDCDDFNTFSLSPESRELLSLYINVLDEEGIVSSLDSPSPQFISE